MRRDVVAVRRMRPAGLEAGPLFPRAAADPSLGLLQVPLFRYQCRGCALFAVREAGR